MASIGQEKSVVLIGDGRMAQESLQILETHPGVNVAAVIYHRSPVHGFRRLRAVDSEMLGNLIECKNVNDEEVVQRVEALDPDLIISVNNFDIIRPRLLRLPVDGVINFHNGPLPKYRGINIPSWAIINGETRHAVTWHLIDTGIDSGPIVHESEVSISEFETAISLIFKCIDEGIRILPELLDRYAAGCLVATPQVGGGKYYSATDSPCGGKISFSMSTAEIDRLVRGLTFHPFRNPFVTAHFSTSAGLISIGTSKSIEVEETVRGAQSGRVSRVDDGEIVVRCSDGDIVLEYLADDNGTILDAGRLQSEFGLRPGVYV